MKNIKFIPTKKGNQDYLTSTSQNANESDNLCFICTKGSLSSKKFNLAWSFLFALPWWFNRILDKSLSSQMNEEIVAKQISYLEICTEPPLEIVVQQLKILGLEVTKLLPAESAHSQKLGEIYDHFYDFFSKKLQSNSIPASILKQLENMPMMYANDKPHILIPAMVSFGSDEVEPYLYKYPLNLGKHKIFFKFLGCTEEFTLSQYSSVLERIWKKSEGKPLEHKDNQNDIIAIQKALYGVLRRLKYNKKEEINDLQTLFVFTKSNSLQNIKETYYSDFNFAKYVRKQQYLERLSDVYKHVIELVNMKHPWIQFAEFNLDSLFQNLPENLKPVPLSSVLQEKVLTESLDQITYDESKPGVQLALYLKQKFSSNDLIEPIARLLSLNSKTDDSYKKSYWQNEEELYAFVSEKLGSLNFICCCGLKSIICFNGIAQKDSVIPCEYLVLETNEIYINDESDFDLVTNSFKKLITELSFQINVLFVNQLREFHSVIKQIIKAKIKGEWKNILADTDIPELDCEIYHSLHSPEPGTMVHQDLHFSICQNFNSFIKGEYVAFELGDPVETSCKGEPIFIYAIVENEITEDNGQKAYLKVYSIWISANELINVPAVTLYKFLKPIMSHNVTEIPEVSFKSDKEVLENVPEVLHDVSHLPVDFQNKIVKRLLIIWTSENLEKETLCQYVKFLQHCYTALSCPEINFKSDTALHSAWQTASSFSYNSSRRGICTKVRPSEIEECLIQRANDRRANHERYVNDLSYSLNISEKCPYFLPKLKKKLIQPLQARKLLIQVENDMEILENLPKPNWSLLACYLVSRFSNFSPQLCCRGVAVVLIIDQFLVYAMAKQSSNA